MPNYSTYDNDGFRRWNKDGSHACETDGCDNNVEFDDEPYCYTHSPDSGSSFFHYSYRMNTFMTGKF